MPTWLYNITQKIIGKSDEIGKELLIPNEKRFLSVWYHTGKRHITCIYLTDVIHKNYINEKEKKNTSVWWNLKPFCGNHSFRRKVQNSNEDFLLISLNVHKKVALYLSMNGFLYKTFTGGPLLECSIFS